MGIGGGGCSSAAGGVSVFPAAAEAVVLVSVDSACTCMNMISSSVMSCQSLLMILSSFAVGD